MPASRHRSQAKRTKTFTGCWTCRARKLKCDEKRPECGQCMAKGFNCAGYSSRLQWLAPETGLPTTSDIAGSSIFPRNQLSSRRWILPARFSILESSELEDGLNDINNHDCGSEATSCSGCYRGPFGVFCINSTPYATSLNGLDTDPNTIPTSAGQDTELDWTTALGGDQSFSPSQCSDPESIHQNVSSNQPPWNWDDLQKPYVPTDFHVSNSPRADLNGAAVSFRDSLFPEHRIPPSMTGSQPSVLPEEHRFLLQHYIESVVEVFCVVQNARSPWKTVHLPRVLQGVGEMATCGSTSNARNALLHAILAVSAYTLVNKKKAHVQDSDIEKWSSLAAQLRWKAIQLLKRSVEEGLHYQRKFKYKDLLAAMLSMVTIDVVSGDTSTTELHLDGCEQLIRSTRRFKAKYSGKARGLHRVYFYLRTMYSSTRLWKQNSGNIPERSLPQLSSASSEQAAESLPLQEALTPDSCNLDQDEDECSWLDLTTDSPSDMSSYEFIYGVPASLVVLLRKATRAVQISNQLRLMTNRTGDSTSLSQVLLDLEAEILEWPIEKELAACPLMTEANTVSGIIENQTRAFYNAIIIYFSQHVRLMHYRHLRPYVIAVLDHLDAIDKIKNAGQIFAGPLFWPAFIAASEAFDPDLQSRFRGWFDRVKMYGFQSALTGNEIALEVWNHDKERTSGKRMTSYWRTVTQIRQAHLMLT